MLRRGILIACFAVLFVSPALAAEKTKTVLLIGKDRDHPYQTHEYMAWCKLLAGCLEQTPGVKTIVVNGWPKDEAVLDRADAVVFYTKQAGDVLFAPEHRKQADELLKRGVGLTAIHWGTGATGDEKGQLWLKALGGWFHNSFSKLKFATLKIRQPAEDHPVCRGWKPYDLHDEYYLKLRFAPGAKPIMTVSTDDTNYVVGWLFERADGGRSFGCVLGHFHKQFAIEPFRRSLVNGILWTLGKDIPAGGAPCKITPADMKLPPDTRKKK